MKNTLIALAIAVLPLTANAGDTSKEVIPAPETAAWFAGVGVEEMDGLNTELYTFKLGMEFPTATEGLTWAAFVETGYSDQGDYVADRDNYVPITANIEARYNVWNNFSVYAGGGLGTAWSEYAELGTEWNFIYQAFAGIGYDFSDTLTLDAGVRNIWTDSSLVDDSQFTYGISLSYKF